MSDKDKTESPMDQMFEIWEKGQDAFFRAQTEAVDTFNKSFENMPDFSSEMKTGEAFPSWDSFIKTWVPDWDPNVFANKTGDMAGDFTKTGNAFLALLEPANWTKYAPEQLRVILQSIADGPKFADLATPQHEAAETWRETLDYTQAATDMGKIMQDAWIRTYGRFNESHSIEDLKASNPEAAMNAWLSAANHELLETQRTPEFMNAQKRMIRASTEIKARQKDTAEAWSEMYQMPTRTEIDDLAKTVQELRRELRKMKRELASLKAD